MAYFYPLKVVEQGGERYLVNTSDHAVRRLVYSCGYWNTDLSGQWYQDEANPHYEVHDIPPHSHVPLGEVEIEDEDRNWWRADDITWDDGKHESAVAFAREERNETEPLPGRMVELPVIPLDPIA
jgi:hypothetical protein